MMTKPAYRIGLTGGIATGKSAVADAFAALGIEIIDADRISRELVEPGRPALARIVELFGADVLDGAGQLDRRRLRERIFSDPQQRRLLEAVLHPAVVLELSRRSLETTGPYQILVIPLLLENGLETLVDRILVVDAPEETQLERLQTRDAMGLEQARRMLSAQTTRAARLAAADDVITNTGSLADLRLQVQQLHEKYLGLRQTQAP